MKQLYTCNPFVVSLYLPPDITIISAVTADGLTARERQFCSVLVLPVNTSRIIATQPASCLLFSFPVVVLRTVLAEFRQKQGRWRMFFMCSLKHVLAAAAAISHILTSRRPPWLALSSQQPPLQPWPAPSALQTWFRNIPVNVQRCWSCRSRASWVCPEVCKTKRNTAACMNFPPGGEGKLAKLSINMKNLWERRWECQHYFSIIHHYGTFDYRCCKAYCVLTGSILPGNLQAHYITATNSCVPCCNDISILCARMCQSGGSKTSCLMHISYWLSPGLSMS